MISWLCFHKGCFIINTKKIAGNDFFATYQEVKYGIFG